MNNINFYGIPMMQGIGQSDFKTVDCGAGNYVTKIDRTGKDKYLEYLSLLESCGYQKHSDNGEGLDKVVFTCSYTRDEIVVTVSYLARKEQTVISMMHNLPLSEHLFYKDSYVENNSPDAKTKLYMLELYKFGNSLVFQLKNGHFIINDGGWGCELPYLLDFLEGLVAEGEKPIIEAWLISHAHPDHHGALAALLDHPEWMERICVDGIYYSTPSDKVADLCNCQIIYGQMRRIAKRLKTSSGETTQIYRPQIGQRYYFCDITMDVLFTQELVPFEDFKGDINNGSSVFMYNIEGQKAFFSGDIHVEGLRDIMEMYSQEYLDLDLFTLNHHGFNTCNTFTDYSTIKTLLVTRETFVTPARTRREMRYLYKNVEEAIHWGEGTRAFTFPYTIGSVETLPHFEWKYNEGEERFTILNLRTNYTVPGRRYLGMIFEAEDVLFKDWKLQDGVLKLLQFLKEKGVATSVYSTKETEELKKILAEAGILEFFDGIYGSDVLDKEDMYKDALLQSEKLFGLEHIHNILVVAYDMKTLSAALAEGFRTMIVNEDPDEETRFKTTKGPIAHIGEMFEYFEKDNVLFEKLKYHYRERQWLK